MKNCKTPKNSGAMGPELYICCVSDIDLSHSISVSVAFRLLNIFQNFV